ncbi:RNA polymerase II elongation factor [Dermatophagoides pteronyssinus]|uniref:RNA polymerase II elongation factor n=1 Tax=Dermatophagoides pteronyssinus TaxID=6956 RepID=UPI003F665B59
MANDEELMRAAKKLDKIAVRKDTSSASQAVDILKALQRMKITLDQIQKTNIGKIVNHLRKSIHDEEISSLSKSLIKTWKKLLNEKDGNNGGTGANNNNGNKTSNDNGISNDSIAECNDNGGSRLPSSSSSSQSSPNINGSTNNSSNSISGSSIGGINKRPQPPKQTSFPSDTNNTIRLKCRELLSNALKPDAEMEKDEAFYDVEILAAEIEDNIYKEFKDTNLKYKNRVRSRVSNLNDKKNPDLKLNVLRGHIKPERIAIMTAEEMASNEMKQLRQKFTKEAINDAQMSLTGGTKTDLIKCPACKKSNCTYNQVQTRSADEPMTTFCYCNECGKRWKFC